MQHSDCNSPLTDMLSPFNNTSMVWKLIVGKIAIIDLKYFGNMMQYNMDFFKSDLPFNNHVNS